MDSVGIYIHIPFCVKKCNYCDFPSYPGLDGIFGDYADAVCSEIERVSEQFNGFYVDTVFFGGGTPSLLPVQDIERIMNTLSKRFVLCKNPEITLEANPGTICAENVRSYRNLGFNRISIGLQAAQDRLLQFMGRIHTKDMFIESVDLLKKSGFNNINTDIIFGVPCQTLDDWMETIELVLRSDVPHISAYSLILEKGAVWSELEEKGELPAIDDSVEREMYYQVIEKLCESGFRHYEISNFARPGYECRHNLKYWTGQPYIGFGAAAHSFINNRRFANLSGPHEYIRNIRNNSTVREMDDEIVSEEQLSERLILGLRLIDGVSVNQLTQQFGQEAMDKHFQTIARLKDKGLILLEQDMLRLTKKGLDYANQVWMEFL